ncbi:uncharacterized conserved protein [Eggerthella sp. CAG:1427]|nr:uncharacterized conserved protein [Eggerthella sp. CAG:1427]
MSKLNIDQRTISSLLSDKRSDFLIPDYQRPYAWGEDECATLWEDLFYFAFPDNSSENFDSGNDEYFLGPIVTFKNNDGKQEIIDGQQRLTTIMLLLRAFYSKFEHAKDSNTITTRNLISKCIWKTSEFGDPLLDQLKIDSEVASDADKDEFLTILKSGKIDSNMKSRYAKTFRFFESKIATFINEMPMYSALFPIRILNNVILLPIEAESQDTALRIFSTLNDRGLPLSDADIFKSQFYKYFSDLGRKDEFIKRWKDLEELTESIFNPSHGTPMDELFTRYMYYERALEKNSQTTTQALRDFYGRDGYSLLKKEDTFRNLEALAEFWRKVDTREGFSDEVNRQFYILKYSPNGMWAYFVSVYFMVHHDENDKLDNDSLVKFLKLVIAFTFAYAVERPGVNALRSPVYPEMINLVEGKEITFAKYLFDKESIRDRFNNYVFSNQRPITRSMLVWWAFNNEDQQLIDSDTVLEVEHIFARRRNEDEPLKNKANLEALGNKAMLEKSVNIRAADYRFADKKKYYQGFSTDKGKKRGGTQIIELLKLSKTKEDFAENDIELRTKAIIDSFIDYLELNNLTK